MILISIKKLLKNSYEVSNRTVISFTVFTMHFSHGLSQESHQPKLILFFDKHLNLFEKFASQIELTHNNFRCDIIHTFVSLAFSDGKIDYFKRARLTYIANRLGRPDFLKTIMALFDSAWEDDEQSNTHQRRNQENHKERHQYRSTQQATNSLDEYYKILGVPAKQFSLMRSRR